MDASFIDQVSAGLTSTSAYYVYSWMVLAGVLMVSLVSARFLLRIARTFSEADVLRRFPGPPPVRSEAVDRRIAELRRHADRAAASVAMRAIGLIIVGLIVPGAVIATLVLHQDWFLPGPSALATNGMALPVEELGYADLGIFLADQALRGGLADSFEVFGLGFSPIENNPGNLTYSGIILGYRILAGAVMLAILYLMMRVMIGRRHVHQAIQRLEGSQSAPGN
ncbi:hypothetical protein V0U79_13060 [Hyphobacterium sp. HN65]|uniref:Uncharacterized protein n=1 Tax=Hyphobacterium lacteum TaxID=3116575 RepID=A0ABU7LUS5_9PROT|nr:hypothetical protein [Hyphobacterium sp. HN65]MEE2527289.1 hypothetical protein [Hyphobacterium sp. HN65]